RLFHRRSGGKVAMRQEAVVVRLVVEAAEPVSWRRLNACGTKPPPRQPVASVPTARIGIANPVRARSPDRLAPGSDVTPVTPIWRTGGDDELTGVQLISALAQVRHSS